MVQTIIQEQSVEIIDGTTVDVKARVITVTGKRGTLKRDFKHLNVDIKKTKIKVPIEIKNESDFVPGTKYPKTVFKSVWLVYIQLPRDLIEDIREGSIDLAGQEIDLGDIDDAYQEDLDKADTGEEGEGEEQGGMGMGMGPEQGLAPGAPPPM